MAGRCRNRARCCATLPSWLWFLPALAIAWLAGWHGGAAAVDRAAGRHRALRAELASRTRSASSGTTSCAARGWCAQHPPMTRVEGTGRGAASSAATSIGATMSKTSPAGNSFKGRTGIDRIVRATGYSLEGLRLAYRGESAFRQEVWARRAAGAGRLLARPRLARGGGAGRLGDAGADRRAAEFRHRGGDRPRQLRTARSVQARQGPRPAPRCCCRCCCAPAIWARRCGTGLPADQSHARAEAAFDLRLLRLAPRRATGLHARRRGCWARSIGDRGCALVYGGGNVGLMGARGRRGAGGRRAGARRDSASR